MKQCCTCREELPMEMFHKNRSTEDGLHRNCKKCKAKQSKTWRDQHKGRIADRDKKYRDNNKDKISARKHEYYLENKDYIQNKVNAYIEKNRDKHNKWATISRNKLKIEVFSHYCGGEIKCCGCDENELCILTVDHIDGNGNQHRKEIGRYGGYRFLCWLKQNGYPDGFRVLCWNCQFRNRYKEPDDSTKSQLQRLNYRKLVKSQCLEHYGSVCPCGETDFNVLSLDHVNDDGAKHRRELGIRGFNFYMWLRKNGFPNKPPLQVLCMNCQYRKRKFFVR